MTGAWIGLVGLAFVPALVMLARALPAARNLALERSAREHLELARAFPPELGAFASELLRIASAAASALPELELRGLGLVREPQAPEAWMDEVARVLAQRLRPLALAVSGASGDPDVRTRAVFALEAARVVYAMRAPLGAGRHDALRDELLALLHALLRDLGAQAAARGARWESRIVAEGEPFNPWLHRAIDGDERAGRAASPIIGEVLGIYLFVSEPGYERTFRAPIRLWAEPRQGG